MSPEAQQAIRREAELTERVVAYYRRMFGGLINRMNHAAPAAQSARSDIECMRMCVEAVDLMLENQNRMSKVLRELTDEKKDAA